MKSKETIKATAHRWGVPLPTAGHWHRKGWVGSGDKILAGHLASKSRSAEIRAKAKAVLAGKSLENIVSRRTATAAALNEEELRKLEDGLERTSGDVIADFAADYAAERKAMGEAMKEGDGDRYYLHQGLSHKIGQVIPVIQQRLKKIGEERGEKLAKSEAERIIEAWCNRIVVGLVRMSESIMVAHIKHADPNDFRLSIESHAITELLIKPAQLACGLASQIGLPDWVAGAIKRAIVVEIEDGETEWKKTEEK